MRKQRKDINVGCILLNDGQLPWLPRNPRSWTQEDIDRTAASINEDPDFLEERPILVVPFEKGLYIAFAGNLRHEGAVATKKLNIVPCVIYYPETNEDYETVKRRAIKDNGSFGKWDYDALANDWSDKPLAEWGVSGIPDLGVQDEEKQTEGNTAEEDDFNEDKDEIHVICKIGDIWQLGEHRLMCGDSIDLEQVKALMGGGKIDALITDPPYNVNVSNSKHATILNDNMPDKQFKTFLQSCFKTADAVMKPGAVFYIWHGESNGLTFREAAENAGWHVRQCLIWNKNHFVLGRQDYQWKHEPCLYGWKEGAAHYFFDSRHEATVVEDRALEIKKLKKEELLKLLEDIFAEKRATTVINCDKPVENADHPTMKPVKLIGYLMRNSTKRGDSVLDVFGGSGTTLIAAEQLGRKCYMMELDPHYCDVIIARWEKLTGRKAVKVD